MNKLVILGAGGHAQVVYDVAISQGLDQVILLDDGDNIHQPTKNFVNYLETHKFIVAIGDNKTRAEFHNRLAKENAELATLIHPSAIISFSATIGKGTVVMPNAVINAHAEIGEGVIVNTSAVVEHDCILGNFSHISPMAAIAGGVKVGDYTWLGIGSKVINNIVISDNVIVGAGGTVIINLKKGTYVGVPAERVK